MDTFYKYLETYKTQNWVTKILTILVFFLPGGLFILGVTILINRIIKNFRSS
jgi:TRAP-type mannitol/chloroaromatic compound transport system permease small subunit